MTEPCHKDTALNQQYCDSEHTRWKGGEEDRRGNAREARQCKRDENNVKGEDPIRTQGQHTTHHSRHSIGPQGKRQGGRHTQDGEANIRRGVSNTAALHSPCHPPPQRHPTVHDSPTLHQREGGARRGYPITRRARRDTHSHHSTRPDRQQYTT